MTDNCSDVSKLNFKTYIEHSVLVSRNAIAQKISEMVMTN